FALRGAFMAFLFPWLTGFFPDMPDCAGWLAFLFAILAGIGIALMLALLLSQVTALIDGLFLDDVADVIEKRDYPKDAPG
ncbi:cysteine biosynthesis protein CysZ, partial [Rhizobium ruizarguesonis]